MKISPPFSPQFLLLFFFIFFLGCSNSPGPLPSLSDADQKFLKICSEEYNLKPLTKTITNTLWIYLPTQQPILDYDLTEDKNEKPSGPTEKLVIHFLDGRFEQD